MKISKRERFLVGLLVFVVIWAAAIKCFIGPAHRRLSEEREHLEELKLERDRAKLYLKCLPDLEQRLISLKDENDSGFFYTDLDDVLMDRELQEMAGRAGVRISRLSIGEPVAAVGTEDMGGGPEKEIGPGAGRGSGTDRGPDTGSGVEGGEGNGEEDGPGKRFMEVIVTLEIKNADIQHVIDFVDEVYRKDKSLTISYLDLEASEDGGLSGIVEVRYYYEQTGREKGQEEGSGRLYPD